MNKLEQMQWQYKQKLADFAKDDNFNGFCLDETQLNSLITEVWNEAIKECEGCVPTSNGTDIMHECQCGNPIICRQWNSCREQTLQAISKMRV